MGVGFRVWGDSCVFGVLEKILSHTDHRIIFKVKLFMKRVFGIRRFVVGFATTAGAVLALAFRMVLLWIHARQ